MNNSKNLQPDVSDIHFMLGNAISESSLEHIFNKQWGVFVNSPLRRHTINSDNLGEYSFHII